MGNNVSIEDSKRFLSETLVRHVEIKECGKSNNSRTLLG